MFQIFICADPMFLSAGFYAENLLLYAPQAKEEGTLPIPIGRNNKFAPIALGVSFPWTLWELAFN